MPEENAVRLFFAENEVSFPILLERILRPLLDEWEDGR